MAPGGLSWVPCVDSETLWSRSCSQADAAASTLEQNTGFSEGSADTYHDHIYRGQDKYKNAPILHQSAPPEVYKYMICMQNSLLGPGIYGPGIYGHGMCLHSSVAKLKISTTLQCLCWAYAQEQPARIVSNNGGFCSMMYFGY